MENFAHLMRRLLEIQSGEGQRSVELTEEDERLMDDLRKASKPQQVDLSQDNPKRMRFST